MEATPAINQLANYSEEIQVRRLVVLTMDSEGRERNRKKETWKVGSQPYRYFFFIRGSLGFLWKFPRDKMVAIDMWLASFMHMVFSEDAVASKSVCVCMHAQLRLAV